MPEITGTQFKKGKVFPISLFNPHYFLFVLSVERIRDFSVGQKVGVHTTGDRCRKPFISFGIAEFPFSVKRNCLNSFMVAAAKQDQACDETKKGFHYALHSRLRFTLPRISITIFTSSTTWKSNIPTQMKSAPFSNAHLNPSFGSIAPAANTLKPITGTFVLFTKSTVLSGN